ncbi:MAG TPA: hypothetical protein VIK78_01810 [Ruminiclostridium sp.]
MPLYEDRRNAENKIKVSKEVSNSIIFGAEKTIDRLLDLIKDLNAKNGKAAVIVLDGWYGVEWDKIAGAFKEAALKADLKVETVHINTVFKSVDVIKEYKQTFITEDPAFGWVNREGKIQEIMDQAKISELATKLENVKNGKVSKVAALIVFGSGSAVSELDDIYDIKFYFDKTRQPLLWQMWEGKLVPFAEYEADKDYSWKEYYYCDYYLLHHQKNFAIEKMDYYVEAIKFEDLKLIPKKSYDEIVSTLVKYPVKEVKIYQPGPWGAYRYKDLFDVPGLECNAWNELAGPELSVLIDVGAEQLINIPFVALMQYSKEFVGPYLTENFPELFPMDVWLDDGYFPKPETAERISMPIHNHPSTDYVKRHFNEPIGRYETYYIAEAYEGANTWMGYKDDMDMEDWERKCRESQNLTPIEDWKNYIANWDTNVGDLFLIPPGTVHGHGGNQMVLEMDTCPSIAGTEYSFFTYDFARNSWDDNTKTMTGKPCKMHLEHSFDNDKFRRESWVKDHLLAKPKMTKWTKEFSADQYTSAPEMPFHIERLHFDAKAENNTEGKFCHIVTLTIGDRVIIRSKSNPELETEIELFQSAVIPACFGEYEYINMGNKQCSIVQIRWKKG